MAADGGGLAAPTGDGARTPAARHAAPPGGHRARSRRRRPCGLRPLLLALRASGGVGALGENDPGFYSGAAGDASSGSLGLRDRALPSVQGFRLAGPIPEGGPLLREVNGGGQCPGPNGYEPPGYELNGQISLEDCAAIAREQPSVVGFRWGSSRGLDWSAFWRYASEAVPLTDVPLVDLFPASGAGAGRFTCVIYMYDEQRDRSPKLVPTQYNVSGLLQGRRLSRQARVERLKLPAKATDDEGVKVCLQRWTLYRHFFPTSTELWFCYMPGDAWSSCEGEIRIFVAQGLLVLAAGFALVAVLSSIMQQQPQFLLCLEWLARLVLYLELAFVIASLLVDARLDRNRWVFTGVALSTTVVCGHVLMLPYTWLKRQDKCRALVMLYAFVIVYSPCVFMEGMSYYQSFLLLMNHQPLAFGLLGFTIEVAKYALCREMLSAKCGGIFSGFESITGHHRNAEGDYKYTPMYSGSGYVV